MYRTLVPLVRTTNNNNYNSKHVIIRPFSPRAYYSSSSFNTNSKDSVLLCRPRSLPCGSSFWGLTSCCSTTHRLLSIFPGVEKKTPHHHFSFSLLSSRFFHRTTRMDSGNEEEEQPQTSSKSSSSSHPPNLKLASPERSDNEYTAGIIVIGDEILKGQTADTNSHFLCKQLFRLGVKVQKISTVGDDFDEIAKEVVEFSNRFTHVITSGGVGPTHDDITFEAVAKAFDENTILSPIIEDICKKYFKTDDLSSPVFKMAWIPSSARLEFGVSPVSGQKNFYPLVCVKNVYMFPGIPFLLEKAFLSVQKIFLNPHAQMHTSELYVNSDEVSITNILNKVDAEFTKVQLGSYPDLHNRNLAVIKAKKSSADD